MQKKKRRIHEERTWNMELSIAVEYAIIGLEFGVTKLIIFVSAILQ